MFLAEALKPGYVFVLTLICCITTAFNWRVPLNHAHAIALAKWHADSDTDGDVLGFTNEDANLLAKCNAFNVRHANHYTRTETASQSQTGSGASTPTPTQTPTTTRTETASQSQTGSGASTPTSTPTQTPTNKIHDRKFLSYAYQHAHMRARRCLPSPENLRLHACRTSNYYLRMQARPASLSLPLGWPATFGRALMRCMDVALSFRSHTLPTPCWLFSTSTTFRMALQTTCNPLPHFRRFPLLVSRAPR